MTSIEAARLVQIGTDEAVTRSMVAMQNAVLEQPGALASRCGWGNHETEASGLACSRLKVSEQEH